MKDFRHLRSRISQVDDGELTDLARGYAYSIVFPKPSSRNFIYTTKSHSSGHLFASAIDWSFGVIGRYGLPLELDLDSIADLIRDRQVYFLGDCDPSICWCLVSCVGFCRFNFWARRTNSWRRWVLKCAKRSRFRCRLQSSLPCR